MTRRGGEGGGGEVAGERWQGRGGRGEVAGERREPREGARHRITGGRWRKRARHEVASSGGKSRGHLPEGGAEAGRLESAVERSGVAGEEARSLNSRRAE